MDARLVAPANDILAQRAAGVAYDPAWFGEDYFRGVTRARLAYHTLAGALVDQLAPRRALDVGCGVGMVVEAWDAFGVDAYGVDVSPAALGMARPEIARRLSLCDATRERLPFEDASFDLVTSIEVLEHLPHHDHFAREVWRVLRPGGYFFAQTPKPGPEARKDPTHINVKPRRAWVPIFERNGFELADDEYLRWEHALPMQWAGKALGWLRWTPPVKRAVVKTGTRTLYRKPAGVTSP